MEVKSISLGWYEKCDISENELLYAEELLTVDNDLKECDNILSEVGLQTGYGGYEKQIYEIAEKRQHLWDFVQALPYYLEIHLDEPLRKKLNHGACETISRIHMMDFQVENTLGVQVKVDTRGYGNVTVDKDKLTLEDFLGNAIGENAKTYVPNLSGRTYGCVEEFAVIFQQQYDNMLAAGMLGEDTKNLEDYLDQFASMGEYDHKEDQPFYKALLSNVLDLTIIKPLIESYCGYDLITGEDLTEMERNMKVIGALVDLVTLATGIYGFTTAAKSMGWKKAASYFSQLALVELASDVSATTVATIGDYCDWPMGVTMLLSLGTGLTVGQVGNHLIFKKNGIEIFRKEVSESGELLEDLMSPEEAARYIAYKEGKFYEEFSERASAAGLSDTQIAEAFEAMKAGDYTKMASYFDTSSPFNGAVFWSGNKEGAAAYANSINGTIMEQTSGGQVFDNWRGLQGMYPEWNTGTALDQKPIWIAMSSQYAQGATGNVTYAMREGYSNPQSVWITVEYPILKGLMDDDIVSDIITIIIKE